MAWELVLWLISFFVVIALLALTVYQFVCLADLESDHINPYDSSSRINACVFPEFVLQGSLSAIFLLTWHWFMFLISAPLTYYHIKLYMEQKHLIYVTEIFGSIEREKNYRIAKLGFYMLLFFIVIYWLVATAVTLIDEDDGVINSVTF